MYMKEKCVIPKTFYKSFELYVEQRLAMVFWQGNLNALYTAIFDENNE